MSCYCGPERCVSARHTVLSCVGQAAAPQDTSKALRPLQCGLFSVLFFTLLVQKGGYCLWWLQMYSCVVDCFHRLDNNAMCYILLLKRCARRFAYALHHVDRF